jgi:hypothetical protein
MTAFADMAVKLVHSLISQCKKTAEKTVFFAFII